MLPFCPVCKRQFDSLSSMESHLRDKKDVEHKKYRSDDDKATVGKRKREADPPALPRCALPGCTRPIFVGAGEVQLHQHDYCGRTHAREALEAVGKQLPPPHGPCHACKLPGCDSPVFVEKNGRVHEFCRREHAKEAMRLGLHPLPARDVGSRGAGAAAGRARGGSEGSGAGGADKCSYPDCYKLRFVDPNSGLQHDFCGRTHASKAAEMGLQPVPPELSGKVSLVWRGRAKTAPYTLSLLTNSHEKFASVVAQFVSSWQHQTVPPSVTRILQVRNAEHVYERYEEYKAALEARGISASEQRRFHGTTMAPACSFAIDPLQPPCLHPTCAVCTICATSFDLSRAGRGPNAAAPAVAALPSSGLRYGRGLYFSKVSSKSDGYAGGTERAGQGSHAAGRPRVMFLCKVALGAVFDTAKPTLEEAEVSKLIESRGQGGRYHSIVGRGADEGGPLNFQETVVYEPQAAVPSYLIVYEFAPPTAAALAPTAGVLMPAGHAGAP